jgi:hypothetical protein
VNFPTSIQQLPNNGFTDIGLHSRFTLLRVSTMTSRLEIWPTRRILREVGSDLGSTLDGASDYEVLRCSHTANAMDATGTWDYPIVVLHSKAGFLVRGGRSNRRYWLIEGHLRLRYLNALHSDGKGAEAQRCFHLGDA